MAAHRQGKVSASGQTGSSVGSLPALPLMVVAFWFQTRIAPGNCWAFQGSRGHVVIRLPEQIWPMAFTIWHISEAVSPSGEVSSAPKDFAVSVSLCLALLGGARPRGKAVPEACFSRGLLSDICLGDRQMRQTDRAPHPLGDQWGHVGVLCLWGLLPWP